MSLTLVLVIALITYLSRAASLVFLPAPSARLQRFLNRIPAPLFAGLAALSLTGEEGGPAPIIAAVVGAVVLSRTRSLPKILAGGLLGWAVAKWALPYLLSLAT